MTEIDYTKWEYPENDSAIVEEFNGYIDQITEDGFGLFCQDMEGDALYCEMKMSFIDEDNPKEKPWLKEGCYFRWRFFKVGEDDINQNEFVLYKRTHSEEEIKQFEKEAEELFNYFNTN